MSLPDQYPKVLVDMADCIRRRLALSLPADQADRLTLGVIEAIRSRFEGGLIYIPKCQYAKTVERNQAILAEFDGNNHRELARKHGITIAYTYEILRESRKGAAPA